MTYDAFGQLVAEYGVQPEGLGGVKYIQQDNQGSVRTVTNSNGFVVARTDHQAFGDEVGLGVGLRTIEQGYSVDKVAKQGYGLTENDDATGQQHAWFRKLETQSGRWSSPDPYKGSMSLGNPQSFNRYSYVGNQPTNFVDPSGLQPCAPDEHWVEGFGCVGNEPIRIYTSVPRLTPYDMIITPFGGLGDWSAKIGRAVDIAQLALAKKSCSDLFDAYGKNPHPVAPLPGNGTPSSALKTIADKKQIMHAPPSEIDGSSAHAVVDNSAQGNPGGKYVVRETILVNGNFFSNKAGTVRWQLGFIQATPAEIGALDAPHARALLLLHELLHIYTAIGHGIDPANNDHAWNDQLLWRCF